MASNSPTLLLNQTPQVFWFVGLSGSGKSTLADAFHKTLLSNGFISARLDGDDMRRGLSRDLGFTEKDRLENISRAAHTARILLSSGLIVNASFICPEQAMRTQARAIVGQANFIEIFVDTPMEVCEKRDPKGLYKKARSGEIPDFTGISAPFERPADPQLVLDGSRPIAENTDLLFRRFQNRLLLK